MRLTGKRRPVTRAIALVVVVILALVTVTPAFADFGQPSGITTEAHSIHKLYLFVTALAFVVFLIVESALVFAIFRFRRKSDDLPSQFHGSNLLELVWTGIPVLIVASIFIFTFVTLQKVDHGAKAEDMTVEVTGFQFQWQFVYNLSDVGPKSDKASKAQVKVLGTAAEEPTLVIPVNESVEFTLASNDVIHSFYVRDFLYKLDVVPGRNNKFKITARETGEFIGQCAELCGLNHALMRFKVKVVERPEFDKWLAEKAASSIKSAQRVP
jgi:cytochrome c oxidase subunit 2